MDAVAIYGAGGLGSLVEDICRQAGNLRPVAFLDSNTAKHNTTHAGLPVRGGLEAVPELLAEGIQQVIVAVGDNNARIALAEALEERGMRLASAVHPLASISPTAQIGRHVVISARTIVCTHATIGPHCVLSAGAICEHDNVLDAGVFLGPAVRLAGTVRIGARATIDIGATVIPGRTVGHGTHIAPGTVVIHDVPADVTAGGIPAATGDMLSSRFVAEQT